MEGYFITDHVPIIYQEYFKKLEEKLSHQYSIAEKAREKGFDPSLKPEPEITKDIPERIEKLLGPLGISERMRELEGMNRREMAFKIAGEIALGRFGHEEKLDAAEQAIRTGLGIMTEGVTIAPIQGIPKIALKENSDGTKYLSIYFAGPIRPAGGTAQALSLVLADYVRKKLKLDRFQPTDEKIGRLIEEVRLYERQVRRFQYHVTDEELEYALRRIPVEATGVATNRYEVSNFRNVDGIESNRVRGGALIVIVDGIVGRSRKLCGICERLHINGWEWLKDLGQNEASDETKESNHSADFMEEIIVGRPVFSFPGATGGFRLRYGRARTTGLAAAGLHPASMMILNKFLATGVQLRVELPGKSAAVCPVTSIEPPVVLRKNGDVLRVNSEREAEKLLKNDEIKSVLFLGDILFNVGDFLQNNKPLLPSGYDENKWQHDLRYRLSKLGEKTVKELTALSGDKLKNFLERFSAPPTPKEALTLCNLDIPLHPKYTYLWGHISNEDLLKLRDYLLEYWDNENFNIKFDPAIKDILERLLIPHNLDGNNIRLEEEGYILESCLSLDKRYIDYDANEPLELINQISSLNVKEKAPVFVGARMGRPEKAKERKMSPYIHGLFPVRDAGGNQRDILKADRGQKVKVELLNCLCPNCGEISQSIKCPNCGTPTLEQRKCPRCGLEDPGDTCPNCGASTVSYDTFDLCLRDALEKARSQISVQLPDRIKCVKGLMNKKRIPEHLGKAILRAHFDLSVFKDGTLRFDTTDIPLTHFKPKEIEASIETLRRLGYKTDINGDPIECPDQIIELFVQDIVLPVECGDYLVKATKFIDIELQRLYGLEPYYNIDNREELIGEVVLGLAPHTSAAILGRIIGYTKVRNCYAHPYWHAGKRRNCDGDEDGIMLVLDALLNFSESFLPEQSGGLMDAPLLIIPKLTPSEVDKEAHNVDIVSRYPPEFYTLAEEGAPPSTYGQIIDTLGDRLGKSSQYHGFSYTEECTDINLGSHTGAYTFLRTMLDKLESQLALTKKLRGVDAKIVALKILNSHFIKDIMGNLRAFTQQGFRCIKCNRKYRRPPLSGKCERCGGNIVMTVYRGSIEKYLEPAVNLVDDYELDMYYSDRLELIKEEINSLFVEEEEEKESSNQFNLIDFMTRKK